MSVTAKLTVKLFAGDVLVAESEDSKLWQRVLVAVQEGASDIAPPRPNGSISELSSPDAPAADRALAAMAEVIGLSVANLEGACAPTREPPYLHLDPRSWEMFRRAVPARGPGSVAPTAIAATLLVLWREQLRASPPSVSDCLAVLRTVNANDPNAVRAIRNTSWLQLRNGSVFINPAERSRSLEVARMFCTRS